MRLLVALVTSLVLMLSTLSAASADGGGDPSAARAAEHRALSSGAASGPRREAHGSPRATAEDRSTSRAGGVASCKKKLKKKLKKQLQKKLKKAGSNKKLKKKLKKKFKKKLKRQIARRCTPEPSLPGFAMRSDYLGDSPFAPYATAEFDELRTGPRTVVLRHGDRSFEMYGDLLEESTYLSIGLAEGTESLGALAFDAQQGVTSSSGLAVAYAVRTAPSGLNPETYRVMLEVGDARGSTVLKTVVPSTVGASEGVAIGIALMGSVAVVSLENDGQEELWAVDVATGAVRWSRTCGGDDERIDADSVGRLLQVCNGREYSALDLATGAVLWTRTTTRTDIYGQVSPMPSVLDTYPGYFVLRYDYGSPVLMSSADGTVVADDEWRVDFRTGYLATDGSDGLRITDLNTGATVFQSPTSVLPVGAFDRRLWFWNEGPDVIDMATGARDALAPAKQSGYQHSDNVPKLSGSMWVILGDTNGYGDNEFDLVLFRDTRTPILAEELPRTVITGLS